jgi:hypothetical protein
LCLILAVFGVFAVEDAPVVACAVVKSACR